jgi:Fe-S cluster biogenesis protein NfuA
MSDLNQRIEQALEEIRPFLKSDGGDIELVGIENNTVKVQLLGRLCGLFCKSDDPKTRS